MQKNNKTNDEIPVSNNTFSNAQSEETEGYQVNTTIPNVGTVRRSQRMIKPPARLNL